MKDHYLLVQNTQMLLPEDNAAKLPVILLVFLVMYPYSSGMNISEPKLGDPSLLFHLAL